MLPLCHNNHLLHKVKCILNKADLIPLTPRKGIRGRVIGTNSLKVIKATRVLNPMPFGVLHVILQPRNRMVNPSKTRVFVRTNLVLVAACMAIILMSVLFYLKCVKYGKLK